MTYSVAFPPPSMGLANPGTQGAPLAGRGARLLAKIIDGFIFAGPGAVIGIGAYFLMFSVGFSSTRETRWAVNMTGVVLGLFFLASVAMPIVWNCILLKRHGQTVGKRILKIRIVRRNGEQATLSRIFFMRFLPLSLLGFMLGSIPFVGYLISFVDTLFIFSDSRQCLHDRIADTKVIRTS